MENRNKTLTSCLTADDVDKILELLNSGFDPNYEGGWPIRLAARHGSLNVIRTLIQFGANPNNVSESGIFSDPTSYRESAASSYLHYTIK